VVKIAEEKVRNNFGNYLGTAEVVIYSVLAVLLFIPALATNCKRRQIALGGLRSRLPNVKPPRCSEQSAVVFRQATACDGRQRRQQVSDVLMNDLKYPERQGHSHEPSNELNPQELLQRIHAAETAIFSRLQGMRISSIDLVEGQAIQDALDGLVRLTKETLDFADSLVEVTRAAGRGWA
jgi:hypothetical protein